MEEVFGIDKFNIIQDDENYYFFRALNMADNSDIDNKITVSEDGVIERIRTDRERWEETNDVKAKYSKDSEISLEEIFDHIKMNYRKDTNCISLTSNANVAVNYGRGSYKDKYIMVKINKAELGKQTVEAGQYMLEKLQEKINDTLIMQEDKKQHLQEVFSQIDNTVENSKLKDIVKRTYKVQPGELEPQKAHPKKGIVYRAPKSRISSYQSLDKEQLLEVNKLYAKLAVMENMGILNKVIPHSSNQKLRETIGNAFSSTEVIHYGDIEKENIIEVPKEIVDIFALIQQLDNIDKSKIDELKEEVIKAVENGVNVPEIQSTDCIPKTDISIEEMYELTNGKVEYGKASEVTRDMFFLAKARQNAIKLAGILNSITGNNPNLQDIIKAIRDNGFRIEPEIISRQANKGAKISESVNLNLSKEDEELAKKITELDEDELERVLQNGGLSDEKEIITDIFSELGEKEQISKERYYVEAILSGYNWKNIGIEEFGIEVKNNLINKLIEHNSMQIYQILEATGIERKEIPKVLLNIVTRQGFYEQYQAGAINELLKNREETLKSDINIETVERFLGYYDIPNTEIILKDYQQRAVESIDEIFKEEKFAQVILPIGAGKTFVALTKLNQYIQEHPDEKILYLAPQEEILRQVKKYIVKYIHGMAGTLGKTEDEIVKEVFPNITFATYPGLRAKSGKEIINTQYGMIVLDELHRTGAEKSEKAVDKLLSNQNENVKVLGITATPTRDVDGRDMAKETARKLGYSEDKIKEGKHLASNMTLENAIRMGYVVNPMTVYCAYNLISSGKMSRIKERIDKIEDENRRNEELNKYYALEREVNQEAEKELGEDYRKRLEDDARKSLKDVIGKEEIIRKNVKKGGKYYVFIPVSNQDALEDEKINGEEKIKEYQEYMKKIFEGTDMNVKCNSMLGSYSDKKNANELEEFESRNTDEVSFMIVMNKANEGLHIEGVNGLIWFRALDENSRILYLQQLGRIIYALDENNPVEEDQRPIIIDLPNNSLTVKMEKEFENMPTIDDLESLKIVINWTREHDGMLPNRESTNKQEQHYYAVLRKIQNKYSKYLDYEFYDEEIEREEIEKINSIIELADEIDLWDIDLPPMDRKYSEKENDNIFEVTGVLKDFVELEEDIDNIENETAIAKLVKVCQALEEQGLQFNNFAITKSINKKLYLKTLQDIVKENPNINIEEVMEKIGIDIHYKIGYKIQRARSAVNGTRKIPMTEEEKNALVKLGVIDLENETSIAKLVKVCQALADQGFQFKNFVTSKTINKNLYFKTLREIAEENPNINIEKVMEETGVNIDYAISDKIQKARGAANGTRKKPITEEEKSILVKLGVIDLENETAISEFVRVCKALEKQRFEFGHFSYTKVIGKKQHYKTLKDIAEECPNIDMEQVIKEANVDYNYKFANKRAAAQMSIRGIGNCTIIEEEKNVLIELGVIKAKSKDGQEIGKASFTAGMQGTEKCDEAQAVLNQAIRERTENKEREGESQGGNTEL